MTPTTEWAEMLRRLVEGLSARAAGTASAGGAGDVGAHADGPVECRWCPVCQGITVLRGERPEVTAALADVLTATATALRTFAAEAPRPAAAGDPPEGTDGPAKRTGDPPPVAQRIDIA